MTRLVIVLCLLVHLGHVAHATTRRVAIVVGNNVGVAGETPLRYAESDAEKFGRVLVELGGVAADDLFVLQGRTAAAVEDAFARAKRRIADLHRDPANRIVALFYFSGHSDGEALELGRDRLTFGELRRWLAAAGADVRVALVDSCKSGALLATKGGTPGPGFQIRLTDDLASSGEVLLTSSAADEVALESREIRGSFFTHHFISGLRGAADASGDGLVTLGEAYQYAYAHTIAATGETIVGPQHPAYDYRVSGQGEIVLAELTRRTAMLELPAGFDRVLVIDARDQITAELASDAHGPIAVEPGRYVIRAMRGHQAFAGQVTVALASKRTVRADELARVDTVATIKKGADPSAAAATWSTFVGAGGGAAVASGLGIVPNLRAELASPRGLSFALAAGTRRGDGFRESSTLVFAGYRWGIASQPWSAWLGGEIGGGILVQSQLQPAAAYSGAAGVGLLVGGSLALGRGVALALEGTLPGLVVKRDNRITIVPLPSVFLGLNVRL